jgi:uncharacterized membrane protein
MYKDYKDSAHEVLSEQPGKYMLFTLVFVIICMAMSLFGIIPVIGSLIAALLSLVLSVGYKQSLYASGGPEFLSVSGLFSPLNPTGLKCCVAVMLANLISSIPVIVGSIIAFILAAIVTAATSASAETVSAGVMLMACIIVIATSLVSYSVSLRFRFIPYLSLDNEEMSIIDLISKSNEMMKGYKMEMFKLDLSFFWWYFLSPLTLYIILLRVVPYRELSVIEFYKDLCDTAV